MLKVIKIGGKLVENDRLLDMLCDQLPVYYPDCILIHGGGNMAGQLSARLGIETHMYEGRRITDRETLEVTVMAYAGLANKKITAALQTRGINACGLSGCDMALVRSRKREVKEIDWGFVGDIDDVNTGALVALLGMKVMPVLSPITFSCQGQLLNTNADSVASAVAIAMSGICECELIYCLDKPGVLLDVNDAGSVIPVLDEKKYREYLAKGYIYSGMLPKLENAFKTLATGVKRVRLTDPAHLEGGTVIE